MMQKHLNLYPSPLFDSAHIWHQMDQWTANHTCRENKLSSLHTGKKVSKKIEISLLELLNLYIQRIQRYIDPLNHFITSALV